MSTTAHPSRVPVPSVPLAAGFAPQPERPSSRLDTFALNLGARCSVSVLLLAAVLVVVLGAASMQDALRGMRDDMVRMSGDLATADHGVDQLQQQMRSVPAVQAAMTGLVRDVDTTATQVQGSVTALHSLRGTTTKLGAAATSIDTSTDHKVRTMRRLSTNAKDLQHTTQLLAAQVPGLTTTQTHLQHGAERLDTGVADVDARLGWVVRVTSYMTAPLTTQGFSVRAQLPPAMLPPIPGLHATVEPVQVLPRGAWPVYAGK